MLEHQATRPYGKVKNQLDHTNLSTNFKDADFAGSRSHFARKGLKKPEILGKVEIFLQLAVSGKELH
ncbi:hypothetical protein EYC80_011004 [Monilinia laxa]|uniref:Uncharacterized protein n=1 Tax=Monilinia laxa TaxID=61186 RepID=A0A5N6JRK1_MONLA|nr:hypothetical protein EYC80_011004 [Monilinia laxa]